MKVFSALMSIVFVLSMLSVDSSVMYLVPLCLSGAWLTVYAKANNWFYPEDGVFK